MILFVFLAFYNRFLPVINEMINRTINMKNRIFKKQFIRDLALSYGVNDAFGPPISV